MKSLNEIDIHQTKKIIENEETTIVDIRDPQSYQQSRIENAVLVNDSNIGKFMATADKAKPLICYCYHGITSQAAAHYFSRHGFESVYTMSGGFEDWRCNYPTVSS